MKNWLLEKLVILSAYAQGGTTGGGPQGGGTTGGGPKVEFLNPLGATNITDLINIIINFLLAIGAPILTLMVIIGGGQIMFAAGDPKKFETGKKTIVYAVIGFGILLVSKGVALLVVSILSGK